jgi:hypothetical protein
MIGLGMQGLRYSFNGYMHHHYRQTCTQVCTLGIMGLLRVSSRILFT